MFNNTQHGKSSLCIRLSYLDDRLRDVKKAMHAIESLLQVYEINVDHPDNLALYKDLTCRVLQEGNLTTWLGVKIGVTQGCTLPPLLFLIKIGWVLR